MSLFPFLLLAHLIGDFVLQSDRIAGSKRFVIRRKNGRVRIRIGQALRRHVQHHTIISLIAAMLCAGFQHRWLWIFLLPFFTSVSHLLIDIAKLIAQDLVLKFPYTRHVKRQIKKRRPVRKRTSFPRKLSNMVNLLLFVLDQLMHIGVIVVLCFWYSSEYFQSMYNTFLSLIAGRPILLSPSERILTVAILMICTTFVSGTIVKIVTAPGPSHGPSTVGRTVKETSKFVEGRREREVTEEVTYSTDESPSIKRGTAIGYTERLIVTVVIIFGTYTALAFIIAAKSLARFKKLDQPDWAEYFLLGTLTSIFLGSFFGIILSYILNQSGLHLK